MQKKVLEIVNTILENRSKQGLASLDPSMNLRNDIGFDSLDLAELTVRIEAEYNIDVFEDGIVYTVEEVFERLRIK